MIKSRLVYKVLQYLTLYVVKVLFYFSPAYNIRFEYLKMNLNEAKKGLVLD